ncbi:MAG: PEGA domain-containing protein [Myxococcales bacterium]|nr:PEGA domain-containing protein [Myxococcales bacterium]
MKVHLGFRQLVAALLLVIVAAFALPVVAADPVEAARELMEEGRGLFKEGRYEAALDKFEAAYATHAAAAFLYNAAFAAEKAGKRQLAITRYDMYLAAEPDSPYADHVRGRIAALKKELEAKQPEEPDPKKAPVPADAKAVAEMPSLVRVLSEPAGAPLVVYERTDAKAGAYRLGQANPGWRKIAGGFKTPKELSLKEGTYHVVVERFADYNANETQLELSPGHVYTFKAALSQGKFLGQLLLQTNVETAKVYVDDPPPHKSAPMFRGPGSLNLDAGEHEIWVEAPGYETGHRTFDVRHGETTRLDMTLERSGRGFLVIEADAPMTAVKVDGAPTQLDSLMRLELKAGSHDLWIDADGRKVLQGKVDVPGGQELTVRANMVKTYPRAKAFVLGGFAIGAAVGGVFLHLEAEKPVGQPHDQTVSTVFNVTRFVAFGTSGILAGLAIFYAVYDPLPESFLEAEPAKDLEEAAVIPWLSPWGGPDGGGLNVGLSF